MLFIPFPQAWRLMGASVFFMFLSTRPSNTALANVALPKVRATAFALNILVIHALGDVLAFPTIGYIAGHTTWTIAFLFVSGMMLVSGTPLVDRNEIPRGGYIAGRAGSARLMSLARTFRSQML